jgi:hypothetical protein
MDGGWRKSALIAKVRAQLGFTGGLLPLGAVFKGQGQEIGWEGVEPTNDRVFQSVCVAKPRPQSRTQLLIRCGKGNGKYRTFLDAVLDRVFLVDHADVQMILSEQFQRIYMETKADAWGVKIVMGIAVLARDLDGGDTVYPQYVNDESGTTKKYIFPSPGDLAKLVAVLRVLDELTWSAEAKLVFGRGGKESVAQLREVTSGVEVTLLRTPPAVEGVVDAECLMDVSRRQPYVWAFAVRNEAYGLDVSKADTMQVADFLAAQYVVPSKGVLEELAQEQEVSKLVAVSTGGEWTLNARAGVLAGRTISGK